MDSTISLLSKFKIPSFWPSSVLVQLTLCRTCSEATLLVFHGKSSFFADAKMSCHMGKPTICLGENKGSDQLRSNCKADQPVCSCYSDSTVPLLLKSKFQASSSFLWLYRSVCVGPGWKPHCWFSHEAAPM